MKTFSIKCGKRRPSPGSPTRQVERALSHRQGVGSNAGVLPLLCRGCHYHALNGSDGRGGQL